MASTLKETAIKRSGARSRSNPDAIGHVYAQAWRNESLGRAMFEATRRFENDAIALLAEAGYPCPAKEHRTVHTKVFNGAFELARGFDRGSGRKRGQTLEAVRSRTHRLGNHIIRCARQQHRQRRIKALHARRRVQKPALLVVPGGLRLRDRALPDRVSATPR